MIGVVEFLRARLAEDEQRARRGYYSDTHWEMWTAGAHLAAWHAWRLRFPRELWDVAANDAIADATRDALRERVTAHEADRTARALAEVEAKRKILDDVLPTMQADEVRIAGEWGVGSEPVREASDDLLSLLALPYAAHPDYDERWRP